MNPLPGPHPRPGVILNSIESIVYILDGIPYKNNPADDRPSGCFCFAGAFALADAQQISASRSCISEAQLSE